MNTGPAKRSTLRDQWRLYGDRPPVARWVSRGSLVLGLVGGVALAACVAAVLVKLAIVTVTAVLGWLF